MSFDLSRVRFNARNDFLGVVMQQGRVQLDSDWNDWVAQLVRRIQAGTLDTVGAAVVPRETPDGFSIQADGGKLTIGPGRIYVDGLLAENHGAEPDSWDRRLAEEVGTAPVDYDLQRYRPELQDESDLPSGGPHLVYLDVWRRDVTHLQKPDLVEQAVGVDTTGRLQTVWQVKLLPDVGNITCYTDEKDIPGWPEATRPSEGRLSTGTGDPPGETGPCQVPPQAGYRGLENQLYRVEIHKGGPRGTATFKWSRDNATVATTVTHINPSRDQLTVESMGRDAFLRFHNGDWVEVTDDWRELRNEPGELRRIELLDGVDDSAKTIKLETPLPAGAFPADGEGATAPGRHTRIRRWDQSGQVHKESGDTYQDLDDAASTGEISVPDDATRLFLENGILVQFDVVPGPGGSEGEFRSGDHWVFEARSADASVKELDEEPPLGIHHHYARLAIVTFPGAETDCRTLWPPVYEGESCDCTVCVTAEAHNDGTATIQQAIDRVKDSGGTICLGTGTFHVREPMRIAGARSMRIRGQGHRTILLGDSPGSVVQLSDGAGIALENLTLIGSAAGSKTTPAVSASNLIDLSLEHVNIVNVAAREATSAGLELSGYAIGCSVADCVVVAERGIISAGGKRDYLLTAELRARSNLFYCRQRGFSFEGISLHFGACALTSNLILGCSDASVVATGGVLPGSTFTISDNVIFTEGGAIQAGVDGLRIERNEITALGRRNAGDGIALERGLDPVALDHTQIIDNRIAGMGRNGIAIRHRLSTGMIKQNVISEVGLGGLVVEEGGSAQALVVENNHFSGLGGSFDDPKAGFAGLQLLAVDRADVLDNLLFKVARGALRAPDIAAVLCLGASDVRIAGNRIHDVGPEKITGSAAALRFPAQRGRLAIDDNTVSREADQGAQIGMAKWYALHVGRSREEQDAGSIVLGSGFALVDGKKQAFLITAGRIWSILKPTLALSARGNRFLGQMTEVALVSVNSAESCLFAENHCEVFGRSEARDAQLAMLRAVVVNASNNRLVGIGGRETVSLRIETSSKMAVVLGNVTSGQIQLNGGTPPPPWKDLNVLVD